jgi:carboxypeptidase C (cathepsin A)
MLLERYLCAALLAVLPLRFCDAAAAWQQAEESDGARSAQDGDLEADEEDEEEEEPDDADHVVTQHTVALDGRALAYTARAGTIGLAEETGEPRASVFFVAYTLDDTESSERPITFCFNGGPGSSSVWLHLGTIGPRRVELSPEGWAPPPPYRAVDNEHTWLAFSDLVFVDPVTTGYSRPAEGEGGPGFHGVDQDIESVAEFIRLYTTRYQRWASPKYLAGESYGTTRAAGLAGHLQDRHGMYLNGIVLISSILNFQTARFDEGNDLPYPLFLPTYAATAWYHGRLADDLQADLRALLDEVEAFALGEYTAALAQGDALDGERRRALVESLARYTGLSPEYVSRTDLRIDISRFVKELLRAEGRTVGRLDSRFQGIDRDAAGERYEYDPSYSAILGPVTAVMNHYVRAELGYESDLPYEILTGRVRPWDYGSKGDNRYLNVADTLRSAMTRNPHLRVYVASGYYDLATPYFATQHTFDHLGLDPTLRSNVVHGLFESGHMMYIHAPSRAVLQQDVGAFYEAR